MQENLQSFKDSVMRDAMEQSTAILTRAEDGFNEEIARREEVILTEIYSKMQAEIIKIKNEANRGRTRSSLEARREVLACREKITEKAMDELRLKIEEFTRGADYADYLKRQLEKAGTPDENTALYCREKDRTLFKKLLPAYVEIKTDESIVLGGFTMESCGRVYVQTLDEAFDAARRRFSQISGLFL